MFWSGNLIFVKELNYLLKSENVTLTQVLEADDILQECKADNKALIQFLTKPEILAELITLITEEPPQNVELASQYRHASIACEVLTSHLSMLSDRLSLDTVQMNRLCDFINKEPPLNPLLASYFSKTVEMLLERSPKQDWYLYHIVCLRVLDFFKSRRDFLPNLLRHLSTSAIADTFKYFIRLDDLFNKIVMEWLEEHQFLESLIQIICGTYVPEPIRPSSEVAAGLSDTSAHDGSNTTTDATGPSDHDSSADSGQGEDGEKADSETNEKPDVNHKGESDEGKASEVPPSQEVPKDSDSSHTLVASYSMCEETAQRMRAVAAANAAGLLCDLILNGCAADGCTTRVRTVWAVVSVLQSGGWVRALLAAMFTCPPRATHHALVHGAQVLLALLSTDPILAGQCAAERTSVELAVAPHLPLLHQALLHNDNRKERQELVSETAEKPLPVGAARVHVAALVAQLALSDVQDVATAMITLGTPGVLVDLFLRHRDNNFLHAQVYALIKHALNNRAFRTQYAAHLLVECDLLTRFMDVFEENESKNGAAPRAGYMGHVVLTLRVVTRALSDDDGALRRCLQLSPQLLQRLDAFLDDKLKPLLQQHDTPLGGYYPSENIYEVENMGDNMEGNYEFNDMTGGALDELGELADDVNIDAINEVGADIDESGEGGDDQMTMARNSFLELANQRFDDDMWEDSPDADDDLGAGAPPVHDVQDVLAAVSPWESSPSDGGCGGEGWAQWGAAPHTPADADPFATVAGAAVPGAAVAGAVHAHRTDQTFDSADFAAFWPCDAPATEESRTQDLNLEQNMERLRLEGNMEPAEGTDAADAALATRLLAALAAMPGNNGGAGNTATAGNTAQSVENTTLTQSAENTAHKQSGENTENVQSEGNTANTESADNNTRTPSVDNTAHTQLTDNSGADTHTDILNDNMLTPLQESVTDATTTADATSSEPPDATNDNELR